ncbi:AAA family ATPase [Terrabacter sp. GCM10028922]|uniref:ParA family protein n=1 Tax=Terrabacter sp. GCM10028922 TaxID=3273428 RepID=UPI0036190930
MLGVSRETADETTLSGENGHAGGEDVHAGVEGDGTAPSGEAPATPAERLDAEDLGASEEVEVGLPAERLGATEEAELAGSPPPADDAASAPGVPEQNGTSSAGVGEIPAGPSERPAETPSVQGSESPIEAPVVSQPTRPEAGEASEEPVDNAVDEASEFSALERRTASSEAGDNIVDEHAGDGSAPLASTAPPEASQPADRVDHADRADRADRDALAAAIPTPGDDTPLARELAENARRRIQLTGRRFPKPTSPRVLTVANQKGGVGKTTTTVNIAAALAQAGLKALVIDLDPQGNASTALGIDHHAEVPSIYDVLVDGTKLLDVIQPCTTVENLFCAPATIDLAGAEIELVSLVARESRLQKAIAAAGEQGHEFDYILIDCPPSLGLLTVNAMVAASEVFIPIQCEYYALEGLSQLLKNIDLVRVHLNPSLHVSTILLTMYDGRTRLSAQVADEVREHFPEEVLRTTVPRSVRVSEAPSFGETVMTYDPASSGALAYLEAAGEIADRGAAGRT